MDKFKSLITPQTEYQNNLKELSLSPIEQWLKDFTLENIDKEQVELLPNNQFELFNDWCKKNSNDYKLTSLKLGVRLSNMNIKGLLKGNHTKKGNTRIFDIKLLKQHFKIDDNLVDFIEPIN